MAVPCPFLSQALPGVIRTNSYCGLDSASEFTKCEVFVGCFEYTTNFYDWASCMEHSVRSTCSGTLQRQPFASTLFLNQVEKALNLGTADVTCICPDCDKTAGLLMYLKIFEAGLTCFADLVPPQFRLLCTCLSLAGFRLGPCFNPRHDRRRIRLQCKCEVDGATLWMLRPIR